MLRMTRPSVSISLPAALLSAFFKRLRRNLADLTGHRPIANRKSELFPLPTLAHIPLCKPTLGGLESLCLRSAADAAVEPPEGHALLVLLDVGEVGVGLGELHARKNGCGFPVCIPRLSVAASFLQRCMQADRVFLKWTRRYWPRETATALRFSPMSCC